MRVGILEVLILVASSTFAQQSEPDVPDVTLRFNVNLVQVDAVVTDHVGRRVPDLRANEFEVLQNGLPQKITHFSYVPAVAVHARRPIDKQFPGLKVAQLERAAVRRIVVMLIHDETLQFADFATVRKAIMLYVDQELQPGDLLSVRRSNGGSSVWEQFSADRNLLEGAVRRLVWRPGQQAAAMQWRLFGSLHRTIKDLSQLPGRKSIVVIGPGIPTSINLYSDPNRSWILDEIRRIGDEASRSSVALQTIDARGLAIPPPSNESLEGLTKVPDSCPACTAIVNGALAYTQSQHPYAFLAEMTGGLFQHDNNDLFAQISKAADDSEGYYLIGWYPGPDAFQKSKGPAKYHRLQVKVLRDDLVVRSREGYFAVPDIPKRPNYLSSAQQMHDALFSSFSSDDIDVRLTASVGYDDRQGMYVESLLHVPGKGVRFDPAPSSPGCKVANLELLVTPEPLDWRSETKGTIDGVHSRMELCGRTLERVMANGFVVVDRRPIAQPGPYQLREAIRNILPGEAPSVGPKGLILRDSTSPPSTTIGSANQFLEIPDLTKQEFALTGITLQGGIDAVPQPRGGFAYRPARDSDPAIRTFRAGETLAYAARLLAGKSAPKQVEVRVRLFCEGQAVFNNEPVTIAPGKSIAGVYKLADSAPPGPCVLGIVAGDDLKKGRSAEQWIDFEVRN